MLWIAVSGICVIARFTMSTDREMYSTDHDCHGVRSYDGDGDGDGGDVDER